MPTIRGVLLKDEQIDDIRDDISHIVQNFEDYTGTNIIEDNRYAILILARKAIHSIYMQRKYPQFYDKFGRDLRD